MRVGAFIAAVLAACGSGAGDGADDDSAGDDATVTGDGAAIDAPPGAGDATTADAGGGRRILFQCDAFNGGLCTMDEDGDRRQTVHANGFVPHGLGDGSILFHTSAYRVSRRSSSGNIADLGDGAMARPHPDGRILFQCSGLNGGICVMNADGGDRQTIKATGRVPDIAADGRILFHSDDYHVWRRNTGGGETDLGLGAFPTWGDGGRIVFQCSGLQGGLCRMNADGGDREPLVTNARVPDDAAGTYVFHSDSYQVTVRTATSTSPLGAGANATWW